MKRLVNFAMAAAWITAVTATNAHAIVTTPEPSTWLLMGTGVAGLAVYRFIKKSKK